VTESSGDLGTEVARTCTTPDWDSRPGMKVSPGAAMTRPSLNGSSAPPKLSSDSVDSAEPGGGVFWLKEAAAAPLQPVQRAKEDDHRSGVHVVVEVLGADADREVEEASR
jgi:hypothetical protein